MDTYLQLLLLLAICLLLAAAYLGVFKSVTITQDTFHGGVFIYKDWQGHIKNIGTAFNSVMQDLSEFKKTEVRKFNLPMMGIYYDDPQNIKDGNKCRVSVGMLLQFKSEKIPQFFEARGYMTKKLPVVSSIHGTFPCVVRLSCMIGAMKFYPAAWRYIYANLQSVGVKMLNTKGCIELIEGDQIKYYFPLEKHEEFNLTSHEDPELVQTNDKKKNLERMLKRKDE